MSKLTDAALALDPHALQYKVVLTPEDALDLVDRLMPYNNANPSGLHRLVVEVDDLIPKMDFGGDNPNNGRTHHTYEIGREASRVVYLSVRTAYMPDDFPWDMLTRKLHSLGAGAYADEMTHTYDTHEFTFRWWWD